MESRISDSENSSQESALEKHENYCKTQVTFMDVKCQNTDEYLINSPQKDQELLVTGYLPGIHQRNRNPTPYPVNRRGRSNSTNTILEKDEHVRKQRRKSLCAQTLSIMVANSKGAAKLKYLALLSTEMEKAEKKRQNITADPDKTLEELSNCSYLRVSDKSQLDFQVDGNML